VERSRPRHRTHEKREDRADAHSRKQVAERGKALAIFFGITGGLTALGPFLGGYLTEWTWRSIFWINVPVAIIADATKTVFYVTAGVMVAVYVLAHIGLPSDRVAREQPATRGAAG
jgi:MFS family permease